MTKISKIDQYHLGDEVLQLSLSHSAPEVHRLIIEKYPDKDISLRAVQRYISDANIERGARIRAKVDTRVDEDLPDDLESMARYKEVADEIAFNVEQPAMIRLAAVEKGLKVIDTKLKYSGAGVGGQSGVQPIAVYIPSNGRDAQ
jgi:transaldolase